MPPDGDPIAMADLSSTPAPTPAPIPSAEHLDYRPITPLAVTGFALGIGFAIVVVGSFLFAIYQGVPFYLGGWIVALALGGAALSFVAERQVRQSEGTRAGAGLARWGMWLCLF